jgi:hypothetical protein
MPHQVKAQQVPTFFTISISASTVTETAGAGALIGTVTRSQGDVSTPVTVSLTSSDPQRVSVPSSVTILAGNTSESFVINVNDNSVLDTTGSVQISITQNGVVSSFVTLLVTDDESALSMSITPDTIKETDGADAATVTITRSAVVATSDLTLLLSSNAPTTIKVPLSITIPKGQTSATFPLEVLDDDDLNGFRTVQITAFRQDTAGGSISASVTVTDDESSLEVKLSSTTISEAGGAQAATVTVERSEVAAQNGAIGVFLVSSDTSELTVPPFVLMPKGAVSVTLPLSAVDDSIVDGSQQVTISAQAAQYVTGSLAATVTDNDTPALTLTLSTNLTSESSGNSAVVGTVSRNTSLNTAQTVRITTNNALQATVPPSVTIPRGAASVDFPIRAVDDTVADGTNSISVSASQTGFRGSSASFSILDNEGAALRLQWKRTEPAVTEGDTFTGELTRSGPTTTALLVTLESLTTGSLRFLIPATDTSPAKEVTARKITIPAGISSVEFLAVAQDNTIPEDIQYGTARATATGFKPGIATQRIQDDNDPAVLTLTIKSNFAPFFRELADGTRLPAYMETSGSLAAIATLTRNTATTSEHIAFIQSGETTVAQVPPVAIIPVGARSTTFYLSTIDDAIGCNDPEVTNITAKVAGFTDAQQAVVAVNDEPCYLRGLGVQILTRDLKPLTGRLVESDGPNAATVVVTRSDTNSNLNLVVDLASSEPDRAAAAPVTEGKPTRVVIPAGQTSVQLPLSVFDNLDVEGCQTITISPSAVGFTDPNAPASNRPIIPVTSVFPNVGYDVSPGSVSIADNETPISSLTIRPSTFYESGSSGVAGGTLTRAGSLEEPLTVNVTSSDTSEVRLSTNVTEPATALSVTFPPGERTVSFNIIGVADRIVDGDQQVDILVSESQGCYTPVTRARVVVRDSDLPSLLVKVPASITESGTGNSALGSVTRNTVSDAPLVVTLQSSDTTEVTVPRTVTIAAGQRNITFPVTGVDDRVVDGNQKARIIASGAGFVAAGADITVIDRTVLFVPGLTLTVSPSVVSEGAGVRAARATVTRNTGTTTAMTVSLASNNPSLVQVPSGVVIPLGATSVSFDVSVIENTTVGANQIVKLTASKTGLTSGTAQLSVLDND